MTAVYEVLKGVHILAAVVWLGGALMLTILGVRARRQGPQELVAIFREVATVAPRTFVPASLVLVIVGFALLGVGKLPFELWVILGIVGWAITFVTGIAVLTPGVRRAESLLSELGPNSEVALAQVQRVLVLTRIDLVVLTLIVFDMVLRPS
jgi:uncharacterized membrane protein